MKQSLLKYSLPLMLTLLCGLFFVHSNLKVEDSIKLDSKEALIQLNDVDQHAQVAINPLSSDKKLAIEVAETEEQEEEIRHTFPTEHGRYLGGISATSLRTQFIWHTRFDSQKSFVAFSASDTTSLFRRYIKYQVFRL
ncbi:hypothetical protein [Maribacter aurantiacus]|uniref:Uncharacterized protein n=1 Tax=Maribacter aurantiacus TaxID=1882343 RepID=A0A5R8M6Q0_9FLAO|nr:hypothetical protein [Maribacter aurantiacus]TLF45227.1 hypothetical protein FEK29_07510 [Maribacter aurantiacus]